MDKKAYPSDVTGEEWAPVAPYLTLMTEDAPQREYSLREVFTALRWIIRTEPPCRSAAARLAALVRRLPAIIALDQSRRV